MEELTTEDVVVLVRTAWSRALGGTQDKLLLEYALESIAEDFIQDGAPQSTAQAHTRIEPFLTEFPQFADDEVLGFAQVLVEMIASLEKPMFANAGACEICERKMKLTKHHLIPKLMHSRLRLKGRSREELSRCAMICRICHTAVHHFFSEKTLAIHYNTVAKLLQTDEISKHAQWASKVPVRGSRRSNNAQ